MISSENKKRNSKLYRFPSRLKLRVKGAIEIVDDCFLHKLNGDFEIFLYPDGNESLMLDVRKINPEAKQKQLALSPSFVAPHPDAAKIPELGKLARQGYSFLFETKTKSSRGGVYCYHWRQSDSSYRVTIHRGSRVRELNLGSIRDPQSLLVRMMRELRRRIPQGKPFIKRQLSLMLPKNLTHGQTIKATLDILTAIGFLEQMDIKRNGKGSQLYVRA